MLRLNATVCLSYIVTPAAIMILLLSGCDEQRTSPVMQADTPSGLTLQLGDRANEETNALRHTASEIDGLTVLTNYAGFPCRHLSAPLNGVGYLYFGVDPAFKRPRNCVIRIELEYLDEGDGAIGLEYDASAWYKRSSAVYTRLRTFQRLENSGEWRTTAFELKNPKFDSRQNSGSDFRFCVAAPRLYVRRVTLTRLKTRSLF